MTSRAWQTGNLVKEIRQNPNFCENNTDIINGIVSGELDILQFVQNLADVLTNKDAEIRERGMRLFTKILEGLPKQFLTETQLKFIVTFYTDRLKDNHKVVPAVIEGLLAISNMNNLPSGVGLEFFPVLFREVPCQQQMRSDRNNIFLLINTMVDRRLEELKAMGADFVYGVISSIDGERDPRNLILLFTLLPKFIESLPLFHLTEEMFEVISCYYPIDFYSAANDPLAVTRQDLADKLAPCLCASPNFHEYCLPLLIEKLDSSLRVAKLDSLNLLIECCTKFTTDSISPFFNTLWDSIDRDIMDKSDGELRTAAHKALYALLLKMSTETGQSFDRVVLKILVCKQNLILDVTTTNMFDMAVKVLLTCANASVRSCMLVAGQTIVYLLTFYGFKRSEKLQILCLDCVQNMFSIVKNYNLLEDVMAPLQEVLQLCLTAISGGSNELKISGFNTVTLMMEVVKHDLLLPLTEVIVYNIHHVKDEAILAASIRCFHSLASKYPNEVMELVVKSKFNIDGITKEKDLLVKRMEAISKLASIDFFTGTLISKMMNIVSVDDMFAAKTTVHMLGKSFSNSELFSDNKISLIEHEFNIVDAVLNWLDRSFTQSADCESLISGCALIKVTVRKIPSIKQTELVVKHTQDILTKLKAKKYQYIFLLEALYNSIRQDVKIDFMLEIFKISLNIAVHNEDALVRDKACVLVAHILNKSALPDDFYLVYAELESILNCEINKDNPQALHVIELYGWTTKSLILRSMDIFCIWLTKLVNLLSSKEWNMKAAEAFKLIMSDDLDALNKKCHCTVVIFYKQRVFQKFIEMTCNSERKPDTEVGYYLAWAYILGGVPKTVLKSEINQITTVIVDSLVYQVSDIQSVILEVLSYLITSQENRIAVSLQTILPRLLQLSKCVKSMDIRVAALKCIFEIANNYPTVITLPHRQDVIFSLGSNLDDRKRLVRGMAVQARTRWYLVGSPGEDK